MSYYIQSEPPSFFLPAPGGETTVGETSEYYSADGDFISTALTWLNNTDSGAVLLAAARHEAGLAMGLGEPERNGTLELMQTVVDNPSFDFQAGDWSGGQNEGIQYAVCGS